MWITIDNIKRHLVQGFLRWVSTVINLFKLFKLDKYKNFDIHFPTFNIFTKINASHTVS